MKVSFIVVFALAIAFVSAEKLNSFGLPVYATLEELQAAQTQDQKLNSFGLPIYDTLEELKAAQQDGTVTSTTTSTSTTTTTATNEEYTPRITRASFRPTSRKNNSEFNDAKAYFCVALIGSLFIGSIVAFFWKQTKAVVSKKAALHQQVRDAGYTKMSA